MSETQENQFDRWAKDLRKQIKAIGQELHHELWYRTALNSVEEPSVHDASEVSANILLAYRHLEDAAMRLGKAIQARDGGVSVYKE